MWHNLQELTLPTRLFSKETLLSEGQGGAHTACDLVGMMHPAWLNGKERCLHTHLPKTLQNGRTRYIRRHAILLSLSLSKKYFQLFC